MLFVLLLLVDDDGGVADDEAVDDEDEDDGFMMPFVPFVFVAIKLLYENERCVGLIICC